jgi:hypothetical protein
MNQQTQETLEQLVQIDWFFACGQREGEDAIFVKSWEEAIESCTSGFWDDFLLSVANQYRQSLRLHSNKDYNNWNKIIDELRNQVENLVPGKILQAHRKYNVPLTIEDPVRWDLLHSFAEVEFSTVCPPAFYTKALGWYLRGHFPCGWQGDYPSGSIVVY